MPGTRVPRCQYAILNVCPPCMCHLPCLLNSPVTKPVPQPIASPRPAVVLLRMNTACRLSPNLPMISLPTNAPSQNLASAALLHASSSCHLCVPCLSSAFRFTHACLAQMNRLRTVDVNSEL